MRKNKSNTDYVKCLYKISILISGYTFKFSVCNFKICLNVTQADIKVSQFMQF